LSVSARETLLKNRVRTVQLHFNVVLDMVSKFQLVALDPDPSEVDVI